MKTMSISALMMMGLIHSSSAQSTEPAPLLLKDLSGVWRAWFNHDSSVVIAQTRHGGVGLWDTASGKLIPGECDYVERPETPRAVIMRADHRAFALKLNDKETRVFDATSGKSLSPVLKTTFSGRYPPRAIFSPDGASLLIMDEAGYTRVFGLPDGKLRTTLAPPSPEPKEPSDNCVQAVFSGDGKTCFLVSAGGVAQRHESKTWKPTGPKMEQPHWNGYTFGLAVSHDGKWIATTDSPGENGPLSYLQLWDGLTGKKHGPSMEAQNGWTARFSGALLFATPGRGAGRVIDPAMGRKMYSIPMHDVVEGPAISLSPDGHSLLSYGSDGILLLQDAMTGERKGKASQPRPDNVLWAPDSSCLYVLVIDLPPGAENQRKYRIVKLTAPQLEVSGEFHLTDYTNWMELSPDGRRLLVCQGRTDRESLLILDAVTLIPMRKGE